MNSTFLPSLNWRWTPFPSFQVFLPRHDRSVQFSSSTDWVVGGTWGAIQQRSSFSRFCRNSLWAVLAWAGMATLWCCPSSISSADHGVAHPARCPEGWFWGGCRGVWQAWTMHVSVSWQVSLKRCVNEPEFEAYWQMIEALVKCLAQHILCLGYC